MIDEPDTDLEQPRIMNVKVVNRNDFPIADRFDGVPYVFESNRPMSVPIDAANHIFGWYPNVDPASVKKHVQKRMGWNTPDMEKDGRAERFYNALEITPILYRMVPVEVDEDGEEVTGPRRAPKVNKLMQAVDASVART